MVVVARSDIGGLGSADRPVREILLEFLFSDEVALAESPSDLQVAAFSALR